MANIDIGLTRSRSRNLTVFATLLSMIAPFSINTYLPSFQAIEKEFGITRAMSQVVLYFALAPAIAPLLGGLLHEYFGWRSVFWFLAAFGSLLGLMGFFVSETLEPEHRRSIHPAIVVRTYINSLLHKHFPALIFSWALAFAGLFLYIAGVCTGHGRCWRGKFCCAAAKRPFAGFRTWSGCIHTAGSWLVVST